MKEFCHALEEEIRASYEEGVTLEGAEKLAGKFLTAQMMLVNELASLDLDARMKKTGVKAVKAAIYLQEATKGDKKPSDVMLNALVDSNTLVQQEQEKFDSAEIERDRIQNYLNVFKEAHLHFRAIAKGRFE